VVAQAELHTHFMDSKCPDKGNVHEFLDELYVEKEKLATYSVVIEDKDYHSTIISSLPNFLSNFTSSLLANARLYAQSKTVDPDQLILLISEEYDCSILQHSQCAAKSSKTDEKDEAMLASSNGKGKEEHKPRGVCWNCGEKGHFKDKCPNPAKDMKHNSPKKGSSANTAVEDDSEDEAAFFVEGDWESDDDLLELQSVSDSDSEEGSDTEPHGDSEGDWFSEIDESDEGSGWATEELFEADGSECSLLVSVDSNSVASDLEDAAVNVDTASITDHIPHAEVYDSGCTRHISPY
jgi:Zinc knuckle